MINELFLIFTSDRSRENDSPNAHPEVADALMTS